MRGDLEAQLRWAPLSVFTWLAVLFAVDGASVPSETGVEYGRRTDGIAKRAATKTRGTALVAAAQILTLAAAN